MLRERDQHWDPPHWPTGTHWLCRAAGESCRMQQGGPAQQATILRSSAMEWGSDGKSPRHRSEQADRKMLWGEQNLSPLTRGTFWQPEPAREAGDTSGKCCKSPGEWLLRPAGQSSTGKASHGHQEEQSSLTPPAPLKPHTVLKTKLWRKGTSCTLTPPYRLPQMNQYILTSDSHTPGGMLWLGRGRKN